MWLNVLLKILFMSSFTLRCSSFHIATKVRHKHICGRKLIANIVSHCRNSVATSQIEENTSVQRLSFTSESNFISPSFDFADTICCHGVDCYNNAISQKCNFW